MSEGLADNYFFDDPGYWNQEKPEQPEFVKGYIELRPEVAAKSGIIEARIKAHSESDEPHTEGEQ